MPKRNPDICKPIVLTRYEKACKLVHVKDAIERIDDKTYQVKSQSGILYYNWSGYGIVPADYNDDYDKFFKNVGAGNQEVNGTYHLNFISFYPAKVKLPEQANMTSFLEVKCTLNGSNDPDVDTSRLPHIYVYDVWFNIGEDNATTMTGQIVCLPHKKMPSTSPNTSETTECAIGFHAQNGKYYGFDNDTYYDEKYSWIFDKPYSNELFNFTGIVRPATEDFERYDIAGIIDLRSNEQ